MVGVGINSLDRACIEGHWQHDVLPLLSPARHKARVALENRERSALTHLEEHGYVELGDIRFNADEASNLTRTMTKISFPRKSESCHNIILVSQVAPHVKIAFERASKILQQQRGRNGGGS